MINTRGPLSSIGTVPLCCLFYLADQRKGYGENGAAAWAIRGPDPSVVRFHDPFADRKTQTGAMTHRFSRWRCAFDAICFRAVKLLKNPFVFAFSHALPLVQYLHQ
jgi:hypothetical protein